MGSDMDQTSTRKIPVDGEVKVGGVQRWRTDLGARWGEVIGNERESSGGANFRLKRQTTRKRRGGADGEGYIITLSGVPVFV